MEKAYRKSKEGFWHRFWYGMGNEKEVAKVWLDLIPNEYGLAVVKTGIAVVFKVRSWSRYLPPKALLVWSVHRMDCD